MISPTLIESFVTQSASTSFSTGDHFLVANTGNFFQVDDGTYFQMDDKTSISPDPVCYGCSELLIISGSWTDTYTLASMELEVFDKEHTKVYDLFYVYNLPSGPGPWTWGHDWYFQDKIEPSNEPYTFTFEGHDPDGGLLMSLKGYFYAVDRP